MAIKVYTSDVSKLYVGTSAATKAYVGTTQVWGGSQPAHDYSQDYTTLNFSEAGTFKLSGNSIDYSTDDGSTWTTLASNTVSPTMAAGTKVRLRRTHTSGATGKIVTTGRYTLEGNSMSLVYGDNFTGQTSLSGHNLVFEQLFVNNSGLTSADNFILPATTLAEKCYKEIFMNCSRLATTPTLPATTMTQYCYQGMFRGCTNLTTAPVLSATTLANFCYYFMFYGCSSLTTAPALPATTLAANCYASMFNGCSSLTTAPVLSATTLASSCYSYMFYGCTSLQGAPDLPATTLASSCYSYMFNGCSSLTTAPVLSATTMAQQCYQGMFNSCSSLTSITAYFLTTPSAEYTDSWVDGVAAYGEFTRNENATWNVWGNNGVPLDWDCYPPMEPPAPAGDYFTITFQDYDYVYMSSNNECEYAYNGGEWTDTVEEMVHAGDTVMIRSLNSSGNIPQGVKDAIAWLAVDFEISGDIRSLGFGENFAQYDLTNTFGYAENLFSGNTHVINAYGLTLPDTVGYRCYAYMFSDCTNLVDIPEQLPATSLTYGCYEGMFSGCQSLMFLPNDLLPATDLTNASECYKYMFAGCTMLLDPMMELPATTLEMGCYSAMFYGCTSLAGAPELPATNIIYSCYENMFYGCTSLQYIKCLAEGDPDMGTGGWVTGVGSTGTFIKALNSNWYTGDNGIPTGWDVQIETPFE